MGELFGASHEAYESGDGARAKELSNQAKALREKKDKLHRQAADWIFEREYLKSNFSSPSFLLAQCHIFLS